MINTQTNNDMTTLFNYPTFSVHFNKSMTVFTKKLIKYNKENDSFSPVGTTYVQDVKGRKNQFNYLNTLEVFDFTTDKGTYDKVLKSKLVEMGFDISLKWEGEEKWESAGS